MSNVANQLRQARQAQNLTLQQVADITKIRTDYLRSLEEGKYDGFSAPVYLRGFVRSYATLLKLDAARILEELDAELRHTKRHAEPLSLTGQRRSVLDWVMLRLSRLDWRRAGIGLGGLVVLAGLVTAWVAWRQARTSDPLKGLPPGLYRSTQTVSGETLPLPSSGAAPRH
jgi:cytoskeletal protein RodZ